MQMVAEQNGLFMILPQMRFIALQIWWIGQSFFRGKLSHLDLNFINYFKKSVIV